ncbi:MAG TPA: efflux RND transporter periplasmic adaptor subunit [Bryobacteraceae bacterium]
MRMVLAASAALLFLLLAACGGSPNAKPGPPPPPIVGVASVQQQTVPEYGDWVATLEGYVNANIQPQVTGYLIKQLYREGSQVHKGQVLFEIDPRPFQAAVDQAKGQLAQARGQLGQAQAQLGLAQINVKRDSPLAEAHAVSESQLDNEIQAEKQDQALITSAQASIAGAKAAVETAKLNLGFTKVRSLVNGIAGLATTQIGNLVSPTTVLTTVSRVNPIKVYFSISEREYLSLASNIKTRPRGSDPATLLGSNNSVPLQLTLSNGEVYPHKGRVLFADRQVNSQTGTILIVGAFPNPERILRPGQFGSVRALTAINKRALLVPQEAVSQLQGRYQVAIVDQHNQVHITEITPGEKYKNMWIVEKGLKPGDRVVAQGTDKVRDGETVNPQPVSGRKLESPYEENQEE